MKNVLFIVYYFPPMGGSGVQRPLKFIKYLREYGWNPVVICPEPGIYSVFDDSLQKELDDINPEVIRVPGKTPFHLLGGGKKPASGIPEFFTNTLRKSMQLFMFPDNKRGWINPAVSAAMEIIKNKKIHLIFSTAPPFSNHIIGKKIKEITGLPLVLDYRDSWSQNQFFGDLYDWQKKKMRKIEKNCVTKADAIVGLDEVTLSGIRQYYGIPESRLKIISHGFDPEDFKTPEKATLQYKKGKLNFLYSGLFYSVNQPDPFLNAVATGIQRKLFTADDLHLHFQGGLEQRHWQLIQRLNLSGIVTDYGYVNHDVAASNTKKADALWMISNFDACFRQIKSGKLFEYFGSQKPVLGILNSGVSEQLLKEYESGFVADVKDISDIAGTIKQMIHSWRTDNFKKPASSFNNKYNRKLLTKKLSNVFDEVSSGSFTLP